jgi:hypothetical protein
MKAVRETAFQLQASSARSEHADVSFHAMASSRVISTDGVCYETICANTMDELIIATENINGYVSIIASRKM